MSIKYCTSCGTKHDYTLDIPKFCSNCGTSFGGLPATKPNINQLPKKTVATAATLEQIGEEEDMNREVPQISKIEVEIEVSQAPKIVFGQAKQSMSFAREKPIKQMTVKDLEDRLDTSFENDRKTSK